MTNPISRRALIAGVAASAVFVPNIVRAQTLTPLALAGVPEDSITPVLYGMQSGIFKKYGLDVKVVVERNGPAIVSAVLGGAYQLGKSSTSPLVQGHAKGVPFTIVAPAGIYNSAVPIDAMFVRADSPYKTAADLNGKTFGVYAIGDQYTVGTKAWVAKNGGDVSSIKFVELPISAMIPAIESGRIDAGSMNEPAVQVGMSSTKLRLMTHPWQAIGDRFLYTAWFASKAYAAENRPTLTNFQKALREASVYVKAHEAQTVDMIADFTSVDPATIRKMTRVEPGIGLDVALVQPVVDSMARYGYIPTAFDAKAMLF